MTNFHASCLILQNKGVLLTGPSGSGKSDLSLRLLRRHGAALVSDDQVLLTADNGALIAAAPPAIAGLLEVRGVGIINVPYHPFHKIDLIVELVNSPKDIERLPNPAFMELKGLKIPKISLYAFECSAIDKLLLALEQS